MKSFTLGTFAGGAPQASACAGEPSRADGCAIMVHRMPKPSSGPAVRNTRPSWEPMTMAPGSSGLTEKRPNGRGTPLLNKAELAPGQFDCNNPVVRLIGVTLGKSSTKKSVPTRFTWLLQHGQKYS